MRYELSESIPIAGILPSGSSVTIQLVDLLTDTIVSVSNNVCSESVNIPGLYIWNTSNISDQIDGYRVIFYMMTDGVNSVEGRIVVGGYVNENANSIDDIPSKVWGYIIP